MIGASPLLRAPARLSLRVLSREDVKCLHAEAMSLLDEPYAAEAAASQAPCAVQLGGRVPGRQLLVDGTLCWLAAGGAPAPEVLPASGGPARPATEDDLVAFCRLADALPDVGLLAGPALHVAGLSPLAALRSCVAATGKHIHITSLMTREQAECVVLMARALAGQAPEPEAGHPVSLHAAGEEQLAAALVFARARLPVSVALPERVRDASVAAGGERTLRERLVRHHAAVLAGCLEVQTIAPGAPFLYPATLVDGPMPGAQRDVYTIAALQLAAVAQLPAVAVAFASGAAEPGWEACVDGAFGSMSAALTAGCVLSGAGSLCDGLVMSELQLVMDAEVFSWNARIAGGIVVDDESVGLEVIKQVGIGGNYLGQRHTRRHMKDVWRPRLLDRSMWDAWLASGREGPHEKAEALRRALIEEHEEPPLDEAARERLDDLARRV